MFVALVKKLVTVTDDDGSEVSVTIRKLGWRALGEAIEAQSNTAMAKATGQNLEAMKVLAEINKSDKKQEETPEMRYRKYDRETVLRKGVERWTAAVPIAEGIEDLDEPTAELLHRAILDLSLGPSTKAEAEKERGEG